METKICEKCLNEYSSNECSNCRGEKVCIIPTNELDIIKMKVFYKIEKSRRKGCKHKRAKERALNCDLPMGSRFF